MAPIRMPVRKQLQLILKRANKMQTKTRNALISNHYTHIGIVHIKKKLHQLFINQCPTFSPPNQSTSPPNSNREGTVPLLQ